MVVVLSVLIVPTIVMMLVKVLELLVELAVMMRCVAKQALKHDTAMQSSEYLTPILQKA